MKGRSVIVIAHRLSTVEKADKIIVIDKGQVLEQGTHLQLLEQKGMYASLVKRQLLLSESSWSEASKKKVTAQNSLQKTIKGSSHVVVQQSFLKNGLYSEVMFKPGSV